MKAKLEGELTFLHGGDNVHSVEGEDEERGGELVPEQPELKTIDVSIRGFDIFG